MTNDDFSVPGADDPTQEPYAPRKLWAKIEHPVTPAHTEAKESDELTDSAAEIDLTEQTEHMPAEDLIVGEEFVFDSAHEAEDASSVTQEAENLVEEESEWEDNERADQLLDTPRDLPVDSAETAETSEPATPTDEVTEEKPDPDEAPEEESAANDAADALVDTHPADQETPEPARVTVAEAQPTEHLEEHSSEEVEGGSVSKETLEAAEEALDASDEAIEPEETTSEAPAESEEAKEASTTTTTIPMTSPDVENFESSRIVPNDVLEARDSDNPSTTAIRRDLLSIKDEEPSADITWEKTELPPIPSRRERTTLSGETPESLTDAIFEGSTVVPAVPSRGWSHVLSLALGLVFISLAWFFFADAGARMLYPGTGPFDSGSLDITALLEFAAGLVSLLIILLLTLRSSLGAWVWGIVLTICGLPWLVVPGVMRSTTEAFFTWLGQAGGVVGTNIANNIQRDAYSGRILLLGLALLGVAIIAVQVRRRGRAEEALRARVESVNPDGAYLSARERRRAEKRKNASK